MSDNSSINNNFNIVNDNTELTSYPIKNIEQSNININMDCNNEITTYPINTPVKEKNNPFNNGLNKNPFGENKSFTNDLTIIKQKPLHYSLFAKKEILENEITNGICDLIIIFEKFKIKTDDINNDVERRKMIKLIEIYYESCNNNTILKLVLAEIYKGLKKESYLNKIKFEDMDFDVPDFTFICFPNYVKKQFEKMKFYINKIY
jgi:hypothetical protein